LLKFLKEYWGIGRGGDRKSKGQNGLLKNIGNIAEAVGEDERTAKRLFKFYDSIKKAKQAKFLKEYWGIKRGNNQWIHQNGESKTAIYLEIKKRQNVVN